MPFTGEKIIYKASCTSTNTVAMQLILTEPIAEGTIVITDHQSNGRGQRENSWISEPYKNLTFSLILYPNWITIKQNFFLNIITAVGIYQVLETYITDGLCIKWPNDIYYEDKKIGGILIENVISNNMLKASVLGIGLNVNQTSLTLPSASSLALICGYEFNLSSLLQELLDAIQIRYKQAREEGFHSIKQTYLEKLYWINQKRTFREGKNYFKGIIQGIDEIGRLIVLKEKDGTINCYSLQEIGFIK